MDSYKRGKNSNRPIIILAAIFIVVCIIVGVVTWKVTKDAYEDDGSLISAEITATTEAPDKTEIEKQYSMEELRVQPWLSLRMLRDVLPVHYAITMFPDFYEDAGTFYGNETIELEVIRPTQFILIHIHPDYVNVTFASVTDMDSGSDVSVQSTSVHRKHEFFVITLKEKISKPVLVHLRFEGSLTKGIEGIYKSTYLNTKTNQLRHITSSKFEPTFARRAFPCFDEPNIKANFTITLVHRPDYLALSNMPAVGQPQQVEWSPDFVSTRFEQSVKMSTYLVCFIVCDFEHVETTSARNIPIRVFAAPDKIDQANFALEIAKASLDLYETTFQEHYPLPKQDLIAIPDFVSGAMEHWGLITFRESRMLVDVNKTSLSQQESTAHTVSHEMAHMWFGNLVTMDWWNDLWLNEGFASYMEYLGAEHKFPGWGILSKFLIQDTYRVMDQDSALSSHPIIVDVNDPAQITSVFDAISYSKGSAVIQMLNTIMGQEKFFSGVARYLDAHKWANAKTDDLWTALGEVDPRIDVKGIMDTWTLQQGFPYVNVTVNQDQAGLATITASQSRFFLNKDTIVDTTESPFEYKWYVHLDYRTSGGDTGFAVMNKQDAQFNANLGQGANSWIKFNTDQKHFYRVLYPNEMYTTFSTYLQNTPSKDWDLRPADRAGLLGDAFKLASAGHVSYDVPLTMMTYLDNEMDYVPWSVAISEGAAYIGEMLKDDPQYALWQNFMAQRVFPVADRLQFSDEGSHMERQIRTLISSQACSLEHEDTLHHVEEAFRVWIQDPTQSPSVNLRRVVYVYGMEITGDAETWEKVWNSYLGEPSPTEKELLSISLAHTKRLDLIARLLDRAKRGEGIKSQDFFTVVNNVGSNPYATGLLWDWMRENYQSFEDRFGINHRYFGRMVYYFARDFNSEVKLKEVEALFAAFPRAGTSARYRQMTLESIRTNIHWMETSRPQVIQWLQKNSPVTAA